MKQRKERVAPKDIIKAERQDRSPVKEEHDLRFVGLGRHVAVRNAQKRCHSQ